jgi:hypothetical protein
MVTSVSCHPSFALGYLGHAREDGYVAADKRRATRRAALLPVVVGERDAFIGDAINVGRRTFHPEMDSAGHRKSEVKS